MRQAVSFRDEDSIGAHASQPASSRRDLEGSPRWFLIFTKPASEQVAQTNLERQGYRVYYPRLLRSCRHRGRWIERIVALFPRYLFVQLDSARQSLGAVRSTLGVSSIVRFGAEPTVVPDRVIEALMQRVDPESGLHKLLKRRWSHGSRVNIVGGAFDGLEGVLTREVDEERVVILLSLLGRDTAVQVPAWCLAPSGT